MTGGGWPPVNTRHKMLREALDIIKGLFSGEYVDYRGEFFEVDSAKLWDMPDSPPPIGVAVSGRSIVPAGRRIRRCHDRGRARRQVDRPIRGSR